MCSFRCMRGKTCRMGGTEGGHKWTGITFLAGPRGAQWCSGAADADGDMYLVPRRVEEDAEGRGQRAEGRGAAGLRGNGCTVRAAGAGEEEEGGSAGNGADPGISCRFSTRDSSCWAGRLRSWASPSVRRLLHRGEDQGSCGKERKGVRKVHDAVSHRLAVLCSSRVSPLHVSCPRQSPNSVFSILHSPFSKLPSSLLPHSSPPTLLLLAVPRIIHFLRGSTASQASADFPCPPAQTVGPLSAGTATAFPCRRHLFLFVPWLHKLWYKQLRQTRPHGWSPSGEGPSAARCISQATIPRRTSRPLPKRSFHLLPIALFQPSPVIPPTPSTSLYLSLFTLPIPVCSTAPPRPGSVATLFPRFTSR